MIESFLEDVLLDFFQQILYVFFDTVASDGFFFQRIAAHYFDRVVFQIASTHCQTYRNAFQFVFSKLPSRFLVICIVVFNGDTHLFQFGYDTVYLFADLCQLFFAAIDRNDHYLDRSQVRRQYQTIIIRVRHDQGTDQTG